MKARSLTLALVAAGGLLFAAAYLGSPWLAAGGLMQAARNHDVAAVESYLDLPSVRASLKGQLDERLGRALANRADKRDPLAELGGLLGAAVVDKAVDAAVTPEMIAEAVRTARAPDPRKSALAPPDEETAQPSPKVKVGLALSGLNRFDVRLSPAQQPDRRLTLILHRRGLFGWKLTDVELPQ